MKTETNKTKIAGQSVTRDNVRKITHKFDQLKMYFGEPFEVGNGITIYQPTVGKILEVGESDFYGTLYVFIANPTTYRVQLWDNGIDWNKVSDYELFMMLVQGVRSEISSALFGDVDFSAFQPYSKTIVKTNEDGEEEEVSIPTLYNKDTEMELSEENYTLIAEYLSVMFNIHPKIEHAKGKLTKQSIIEEEKMNMEARKAKGEIEESGLLSLVSACVNHPGFKYKLQELKDVGICQFMDSVQRLQVYEQSTAMLHGMMGGFVDSSKIKADSYNWMRSLSNS